MYRWHRLREAFWFLPALMVVAALLLAQAMLALDRWVVGSEGWIPTALVLGVDGSRGLLTAVAGSVLAVAGTTFSITISVIATASSSYGPRLVRNFMTDRRNQAVLGLFVSTFVYCLIVLRAVTSEDDQSGRETFVPYLAVYLAIVLALANVAALVYFLHHIAQSIQVAFLIARVRGELEQVVHRLYGDGREDLVEAPSPPAEVVVLADKGGFVVSVDEPTLVRRACEHDGRVEVVATPGTHVVPGEPWPGWPGRTRMPSSRRRVS
jgi:uncharacterized membrane protein